MKPSSNQFRNAAFLAMAFANLAVTTQTVEAQCCGRTSLNQPRIVGGSTATRGAYPWMTALIERGQTPANGQFCGGALIAPQWVLTAGHCVEGTTAARLDVVVGAYNLTEANAGGQRVQVTQIITHPSYGEVNGVLVNDIALLKLATPVTNVPLVPILTDASKIAAGMPCKGMGFGATSEGGSTSNVLLHVDLGIISLATANSVYGGLSELHVAAGIAAGGRDTCQGDSGGPLVVPNGSGGWLHAGVVSFGDGCARPGVPGIYTSTLKFASWIQQNTGTTTPPPVTDDFGNTISTAGTGTLGSTFAGKLEVAGDADVIKYTVTGAGTLNASSTGTTSITAQWLNSSGTVISTQNGAPNVNLNASVSTPGTYYLLTKGATTSTTGAYSMKAAFTATPVAGAPEINLLGKSNTGISDSDTAPTAAKGTQFPNTNVGSLVNQVFTISNAGTAPLTLGAVQIKGTNANQFKVAVQPATSVAAGRSATFTLTYAPTVAGAHVADISFSNNDANENPYDFRITGTGVAIPTSTDVGNTMASALSITIPGTKAETLTKGDLDFYKFTLSSQATVVLKTTGSIDTYGVLYNATGGYLTEADDATDLNFYISRSLPAGTYFLEVSGYDTSVSGNYSVQLAK